MTNCLRREGRVAGVHGGTAPPGRDSRPGQSLIAVMLLTAAGPDLTRCGLVMPVRPTLGGLGSIADRRRVAPASGGLGLPRPLCDPRHGHAVLRILLAVTILATAGRTERQGGETASPYPIGRRADRDRPPG
jgi:hypothetical protein